MRILEVTDEQVQVIQAALDMYSRIGIGQFGVIKDHPTFQKSLEKACRPIKTPEIGDRTPQGEILEVKDGKALISGSVVNGKWNEKHEWRKLEDVVLSTNYSDYHEIRDVVDNRLVVCRNMLINERNLGINASWGIFNQNVDESCRVAYDIIQVIRHEYWKERGEETYTVDSSCHLTTKDSNKINFK